MKKQLEVEPLQLDVPQHLLVNALKLLEVDLPLLEVGQHLFVKVKELLEVGLLLLEVGQHLLVKVKELSGDDQHLSAKLKKSRGKANNKIVTI